MKKFFIIVVVLVLLGGGVYLFFSSGSSLSVMPGNQATSSPEANEVITKTSGREVPAGSREYYNPNFNFSLLYPDSYTVHEFVEAGGGLTVTFEYIDKKTASGFQIFITPFSGNQITEQRFKEDIPSGVRKNLKNITIDGATGASFYSTDATLGDTAEVWFVHSGYLYEVNTFKELDTWLAGIMQTWKFN